MRTFPIQPHFQNSWGKFQKSDNIFLIENKVFFLFVCLTEVVKVLCENTNKHLKLIIFLINIFLRKAPGHFWTFIKL